MTIETVEEFEASQRQVEDFALRAHDIEIAVKKFKRAFHELLDSPESVEAAMADLSSAAASIARDAREWATECNVNFDPAAVDDEITQYAVVSAVDNLVHGPFFTLANALVCAEDADGTVYRLVEVE